MSPSARTKAALAKLRRVEAQAARLERENAAERARLAAAGGGTAAARLIVEMIRGARRGPRATKGGSQS